jgi:glycopeptide antibiotics resistance protein
MKSYFLPIEVAIILFPLVAALLTVPYIIYCYRKFGSISVFRTIILFSLLFYSECAYFLVILPLPDPATVADKSGPFVQLIPFTFIRDFLTDSGFVLAQPATWLPALKDDSVLQPLFNLLLTLPWGMYLSYYFKKDLRIVVLLSFVLSLFFELTQLSGLYGLYSKPYRLFDVDDLLLNTMGGILGYWFSTHVLRFLPSRDRIDEKSRQRSVHVGFTRRLVAFSIDALIIGLVESVLVSVLNLDSFLVFALVLCVYSIGVPALFHGTTLGKMLVRIRTEGVDTDRSLFPLLLVRYLLRNAVILVFIAPLDLPPDLAFPFDLIAELYPLVILIFIFIDIVWSLRKGKRLLYERISKTRNASTLLVADE